MGTSYFITGTDTDVGKTLVARTLLLALGARGIRCAGYKPVSAGCTRTPERPRLRCPTSRSIPMPSSRPSPPISPPVSGG